MKPSTLGAGRFVGSMSPCKNKKIVCSTVAYKGHQKERHLYIFIIYYYLLLILIIYTDEIPGFLLSLKSHILTARSEDAIFIFHV